MKSADIKITDLIDPHIHKSAPFYGMDSSRGLFELMDSMPDGPMNKSLRFRPTYDDLLIDETTGASWKTFDLGPNAEHWYNGQITIDEDYVGEYFRGFNYDTTREDLIPDMFVIRWLFVSDKAREVIEDVAPGFCYFAPAHFISRQSGKQYAKPIFQVYVRRTLTYYGGPLQRPVLQPEGELKRLVDPDTWTSFCKTPAVQEAASKLPVFLFGRRTSHPIFRNDLFRELKAAGISGILESTYFDSPVPEESGKPIDFETIFPLDPKRSKTF